MNIADVIRHKQSANGAEVFTITPTDSVTDLLAALAEHNVGALVVMDGDTVAGIVSERDVVRRIASHGAQALETAVGDIMTTEVVSCASTDAVDSIAATMTERRVRHMPVIDDGALAGLVSIGDVVSSPHPPAGAGPRPAGAVHLQLRSLLTRRGTRPWRPGRAGTPPCTTPRVHCGTPTQHAPHGQTGVDPRYLGPAGVRRAARTRVFKID